MAMINELMKGSEIGNPIVELFNALGFWNFVFAFALYKIYLQIGIFLKLFEEYINTQKHKNVIMESFSKEAKGMGEEKLNTLKNLAGKINSILIVLFFMLTYKTALAPPIKPLPKPETDGLPCCNTHKTIFETQAWAKLECLLWKNNNEMK